MLSYLFPLYYGVSFVWSFVLAFSVKRSGDMCDVCVERKCVHKDQGITLPLMSTTSLGEISS